MSFADETSAVSAHVRFDSRDAVVDALARLEVGHGPVLPAWPPRRLPYGLLVSGVRAGWVSIWSPLQDTREWLPRLAATLEAPAVLLEVIQSRLWIAEFFQASSFIGRVELPGEAIAYDRLWSRTAESLEGEGILEPWADEERFGRRMDEIAASGDYRDEIRELHEERPAPEALRPFLPAYASVSQAWELLTAMERAGDGDDPEEESPYAEDNMEAFASYLGIRDASWDPAADREVLAEGDYEDEEGLPEEWREFVVLPVRTLPVIE